MLRTDIFVAMKRSKNLEAPFLLSETWTTDLVARGPLIVTFGLVSELAGVDPACWIGHRRRLW